MNRNQKHVSYASRGRSETRRVLIIQRQRERIKVQNYHVTNRRVTWDDTPRRRQLFLSPYTNIGPCLEETKISLPPQQPLIWIKIFDL